MMFLPPSMAEFHYHSNACVGPGTASRPTRIKGNTFNTYSTSISMQALVFVSLAISTLY